MNSYLRALRARYEAWEQKWAVAPYPVVEIQTLPVDYSLMPSLSGRVAVITGGTGNLGSVVVREFLAAGAKVATVGRSKTGDSGDSVIHVEADVTTVAGAETAVRKTVESWGRADILLHLAGGFASGGRVEESPEEMWQGMMNLNFWSGVYMMRAVLPAMRSSGWGRIVMVGSKSVADAPGGLGPYAASKSALLAAVRVASDENKNAGITINAVLPGTIDTPANRKAMGEADAWRWVKPEALASLMLWLCSDSGSEITGALLPVYGRT